MSESVMDFSEIIELYKEDARKAIAAMRQAVERWEEVSRGGPARAELRRLSHQLRGSGRTYGFRNVTCVSKAVENTVQRLENGRLRPEARVRESLITMISCLSTIFSGKLERNKHGQPA